jgi:hypothetical protein
MQVDNYQTKHNHMKHRTFTYISFIFIILFSIGCGFQGRKYTTGHYWEIGNKNEYEKQNEKPEKNEKQKENGNEELKKNENKIKNENEKHKVVQIVIEPGITSEEKFSNNIQIKTQELLDTIVPGQNHSKSAEKIPSEILNPIELATQQIIPISIWSFLSFAMSAFGAYLILEEISIEAGLILMIISIIQLARNYSKISKWGEKAFEIRKDLKKVLSQNPKPKWAVRVSNKIFFQDILELIGYFFQILALLTIAGVIMTILYFAG